MAFSIFRPDSIFSVSSRPSTPPPHFLLRAKPSLSLSSHAVAPQLTIGNPPEINTKKNTRPHRALERGLDWLLWVYRTVWPLVALAVVARLTSPPPQAQEAGIPEEEGEEGMEGYYGFGEEQQQQQQHEAALLAAQAATGAAAHGGGKSRRERRLNNAAEALHRGEHYAPKHSLSSKSGHRRTRCRRRGRTIRP